MKTLTTLCKFEAQLHTFYKHSSNHARLVCKRKSTSTNDPRNMFELYAKNSHWMGVYERNPLKTEPITNEILDVRKEVENERNMRLDFESQIDTKSAVWTPESKRVGAIGRKLGRTTMWTKEGIRHEVTLIQIDDCYVMDTLISREDGGKDDSTKLILGAGKVEDHKKFASFPRQMIEWYEERGISPPGYWAGFNVSKDGLLLPGTQIKASHFVPGQYLQVVGISIKKGFQGVMKRWGMKGQPASHGQSKTHRKMGATGGGQDPGRIFPGKRMAGHMGGDHVATKSLKLFRVNRKFNLLFVKGSIPGERNGYVLINDYPRKRPIPGDSLPYPTRFEEDEADLEEDMFADYVCRPSDPSLVHEPFRL